MQPKTTLTAALIALSLAAAPMAAQANSRVSNELRSQVTQKLAAEGYEVRKVVPENGMIEVYAVKDGRMLEIYLDSELNILRIRQR